MSSWNALTGSTSTSEGYGACSPFPTGEDLGVILVTEISDDVMDDDDELSEEEWIGDLGWSIRDALRDASLAVLECKYEGGE